jgi:hypothetical protein
MGSLGRAGKRRLLRLLALSAPGRPSPKPIFGVTLLRGNVVGGDGVSRQERRHLSSDGLGTLDV